MAKLKNFSYFIAFLFFVACWLKSLSPRFFLRSMALSAYDSIDSADRKIYALALKNLPPDKLYQYCEESLQRQLEKQATLYNDAVKRLSSLEKLIKIGKEIPIKRTFARVIKRHISAWDDTAIINKGRINGIAESDLVLSSTGIIGKIAQVDSCTATVILTSSPKFHLAVTLQNETNVQPMIFSGNGTRYNTYPPSRCGIVHNIPLFLKNKLISSQSVVPALLHSEVNSFTLGSIYNLEEQGDGLFLQANINLAPISDLCAVIVLNTHEL